MLKCSVLFIMKEIIIFMTACKLVIGNYKGLYNANIWMSTALWGISGNATPLLHWYQLNTGRGIVGYMAYTSYHHL